MKMKPAILVKGDSDCQHYEIIVNMVGTCTRCGQVRDYRMCQDDESYREWLAKHGRKGQAALRRKPKQTYEFKAKVSSMGRGLK